MYGDKTLYSFYSEKLTHLGMSTEWVDGSDSFREGYLVGRYTGGNSSGPHILLIGHLESVAEIAEPFKKDERIWDNSTNPGALDTRSGSVIILFALGALHEAGVLDQLTVTIVFTEHEEQAAHLLSQGAGVMIEPVRDADVAIAFQNGEIKPRAVVLPQNTFNMWRLEITAETGHSSQIFQPDVGSGAILEAVRILDDFNESLAGEPGLTFNVASIGGGTVVAHDVFGSSGTFYGHVEEIPDRTVVTGDLRCDSEEQCSRALAQMQFIVSQNLPGTSAVLTFGGRSDYAGGFDLTSSGAWRSRGWEHGGSSKPGYYPPPIPIS